MQKKCKSIANAALRYVSFALSHQYLGNADDPSEVNIFKASIFDDT